MINMDNAKVSSHNKTFYGARTPTLMHVPLLKVSAARPPLADMMEELVLGETALSLISGQ